MASVRYVEILRLLVEAEVEFVVVGMAAGILQGGFMRSLAMTSVASLQTRAIC